MEEVLNAVGEFCYKMVKHGLEGETQRDRLYVSAEDMVHAAEQYPDHVKIWLMWSTHFAPERQVLFKKYESKILDKLVEVIFLEDSKSRSSQEMQNSARLLMGAGSMLAQLAFRGEKRARQQKFAQSVIEHFMGSVANSPPW